jgi:hypothetical protein
MQKMSIVPPRPKLPLPKEGDGAVSVYLGTGWEPGFEGMLFREMSREVFLHKEKTMHWVFNNCRFRLYRDNVYCVDRALDGQPFPKPPPPPPSRAMLEVYREGKASLSPWAAEYYLA